METLALFKLSATTREGVRRELVELFLNEAPGEGKGEKSSKYKYYVEETRKGDKVYLKRPAPFNNGFDFEVHVNVKFVSSGINKKGRNYSRSTSRPAHKHILEDLAAKKAENPTLFFKVAEVIEMVYKLEDISSIDFDSLIFSSGFDTELIVKALKWLFIEQDVTYWNFSGRTMLYTHLRANLGLDI